MKVLRKKFISKPPTDAQLWARERNWNKVRVTGAHGALRNILYQGSTTQSEVDEIKIITGALERILKNWNEANTMSKVLFLERKKYAKR